MPRKITFFTRSLNVGGAQRQLILLAGGLLKRGHDVNIVTLYPVVELEQDLRAARVPVVCVEKHGRWDPFFLSKLLSSLKRGGNPDVLYSFLDGPNLLAVALKPFLGKTKIVWGIRATRLDWRRYPAISGVTHKLSARLSRFADLIIANSEAGMKCHIAEGFPSKKLIAIPNGIDTGKFFPDRAAGQSFRKEIGVPPDSKLIGIVARLDPMKDQGTFLKAAAAVANKRADVHFVCVGDGPAAYRDRLRSTAKALGLENILHWTNQTGDMRAAYSGLDLAVLSSAYGEGFPNVLGEAMACGVPCVATDVGDSAVIVGDSGAIVPPGNPEALAAAIERALDTPHDAAALRERIVRNYGLKALLDKTEQAFSGL